MQKSQMFQNYQYLLNLPIVQDLTEENKKLREENARLQNALLKLIENSGTSRAGTSAYDDDDVESCKAVHGKKAHTIRIGLSQPYSKRHVEFINSHPSFDSEFIDDGSEIEEIPQKPWKHHLKGAAEEAHAHSGTSHIKVEKEDVPEPVATTPTKQEPVPEPVATTPTKQEPVPEPAPTKQEPVPEPAPTKQEPVPEPVATKQGPVPEPVATITPTKQGPVPEPAPTKQEPAAATAAEEEDDAEVENDAEEEEKEYEEQTIQGKDYFIWTSPDGKIEVYEKAIDEDGDEAVGDFLGFLVGGKISQKPK